MHAPQLAKDGVADADRHILRGLTRPRCDRWAEHEIDLDAWVRGHAEVVRKERSVCAPRQRRIAIMDRDRHDRQTQPLRDTEAAAPERPHVVAA
jgi:hypothetical protein